MIVALLRLFCFLCVFMAHVAFLSVVTLNVNMLSVSMLHSDCHYAENQLVLLCCGHSAFCVLLNQVSLC
jgi:hypothetical protein